MDTFSPTAGPPQGLLASQDSVLLLLMQDPGSRSIQRNTYQLDLPEKHTQGCFTSTTRKLEKLYFVRLSAHKWNSTSFCHSKMKLTYNISLLTCFTAKEHDQQFPPKAPGFTTYGWTMSHKLISVKCTWIASKTTTGHLQHTDFCLSFTRSTQLHLSLSCVQHASIANCVCFLRACSSSSHWFVPEGTRIKEIMHCSKITCVIFLTDKRCWLMSLLSCENTLFPGLVEQLHSSELISDRCHDSKQC